MRYVTAKQLSEMTGITRNSIYRMAREGRLEYVKIGGRIFFEGRGYGDKVCGRTEGEDRDRLRR